MNWINKLFGKKEVINAPKLSIPKGWYVHEAGQNPLHMLWFVVLMSFEDLSNNVETPRYFVSEDFDSFEEALQDCIEKLTQE